ncbi:MAG: 50S ribosomal protein L25 [Acidimicrobiia bacterium]|jgi:large subunit ribosomal protein L25
MAEITLRAETGRPTGSRESRRLRRSGAVPGVVYGMGIDPIPVSVDAHDLGVALHTEAGHNVLLTLALDTGESLLTLPKQVEKHPYRNLYRHVDFLKIDVTEVVRVEIPIHTEGEPVGVTEGGIMSSSRTSVLIEALPTALPSAISLDVSALGVGDSLRIADLPVIDGVEYLDDPEEVVLSITAPAVEVEEAPAEELEGEAAEAAEEEAEAGEGSE